MNESTLQIKIPEQLISDTIKAEMVRQVVSGGKGEEWIRCIVDHAMNEKSDRHYGRTTKFGDAIGDMIREECKVVFKEWLAENKLVIRKAMLARLKITKIGTLVDGLVDSLSKGEVHMDIKVLHDDGEK